MPLTPLQAELGRLLAKNRSEDSYLAGGAALLVEPRTARYSQDLDYFHDSSVRVATAYAADRAALEGAGFRVETEISQPGYVRAVVGRSVDPDVVGVGQGVLPHFGRPGGVLPVIPEHP